MGRKGVQRLVESARHALLSKQRETTRFLLAPIDVNEKPHTVCDKVEVAIARRPVQKDDVERVGVAGGALGEEILLVRID